MAFPPFEFFVTFIHNLAATVNDPAIVFEVPAENKKDVIPGFDKHVINYPKVSVRKICVIHDTEHSLNKSRVFEEKPFDEKQNILKDYGMFLCLDSREHLSPDYPGSIKCGNCGSIYHTARMHMDSAVTASQTPQRYDVERSTTYFPQQHVREQPSLSFVNQNVNSECTEICILENRVLRLCVFIQWISMNIMCGCMPLWTIRATVF